MIFTGELASAQYPSHPRITPSPKLHLLCNGVGGGLAANAQLSPSPPPPPTHKVPTTPLAPPNHGRGVGETSAFSLKKWFKKNQSCMNYSVQDISLYSVCVPQLNAVAVCIISHCGEKMHWLKITCNNCSETETNI